MTSGASIRIGDVVMQFSVGYDERSQAADWRAQCVSYGWAEFIATIRAFSRFVAGRAGSGGVRAILRQESFRRP